MSEILNDVRVLDLTRVASGPWCTQLLADMGATVYKIERPSTGDDSRSFRPSAPAAEDGSAGPSAFFLSLNRGKRSITVNIGTPEGAAIVRELASQCDVLVENYKAGTLAKYGLDYESIRQVAPSIIYCSITGFGQSGPSAARPAYDSILQASAGHMSLCGDADGPPQRTALAVTDLTTGYCAAVSVLGALIHRMKTGEGQFIDAAMLDASIALTAQYASAYLLTGEVAVRAGNRAPNTFPSGLFSTADSQIIIVCGNDRQFSSLARALGDADLAADPRFKTNILRRDNYMALTDIMNDHLQHGTATDWVQRLEEAGVPSAAVNGMDDVFRDPQVIHRGIRIDVEQADGRILPLVRSPLNFSATPVQHRASPALGADTDDILRALGRSEEEISALRKASTI